MSSRKIEISQSNNILFSEKSQIELSLNRRFREGHSLKVTLTKFEYCDGIFWVENLLNVAGL